METDSSRQMLRHALATLAYRGAKAIRGVPEEFASSAVGGTRTPVRILAHIGDLLDWALSLARGRQTWHDSEPLAWAGEVSRFHRALEAFDQYLVSGEPLAVAPEKLFQGPIADGLTHVGQIAMLRRMAGVPMKGENYLLAGIEAGRVGPEQAVPVREFD